MEQVVVVWVAMVTIVCSLGVCEGFWKTKRA